MKNNLSGWWSRRIDEVTRIVYYERDGIICIVSCRGHYN
ncbi:MAG: type II toxin-antitoxin system YoeB family toxin [Lachnospiraceae bacterium]|nr:type II toxin-antitoxin system YoeB family toxin [Lachnospiraceae bacterium]